MVDTFDPMLSIDVRELGDGFAKALDGARRSGKVLEVIDDGKRVATVHPDKPAKFGASVIGMSATYMRLATPGDLLNDLLTPDEVEEYYNGDIEPNLAG